MDHLIYGHVPAGVQARCQVWVSYYRTFREIVKLLCIPEATPEEVEELATSCEKYCEIFLVLFPHINMTPKMNILSCVMPKHIREQKIYYKMLKVEQEGERVNKVLNEIETTLIHMKKKPLRYFLLLKTYENRLVTSRRNFQPK